MTASPIYIVTGGVGAAGDLLVRTALAQFEGIDVPVVVVPNIRRVADLEAVVAQASSTGGLILHTLVEPSLRSALTALAAASGVENIDTLGPLLDALGRRLDRTPLGRPGRYRKLREDYFRRIETIEFAIAHDDGLRPQELDHADIVLIGLSRAGKTPLSMVLAMRGVKAANVPLVLGVEPPPTLFALDRRRVLGLTLEAAHLRAHRRYRQEHLGAEHTADYTAIEQIRREMSWAREILRRGGFDSIDVTERPIEETADLLVARIDALPPRS